MAISLMEGAKYSGFRIWTDREVSEWEDGVAGVGERDLLERFFFFFLN